MRIDSAECTGCGQCIPYCPVGAISMDDDVSEIDFDECTECGNWDAMERTGKEKGSERELKCRYCGHTTWEDPYSA